MGGCQRKDRGAGARLLPHDPVVAFGRVTATCIPGRTRHGQASPIRQPAEGEGDSAPASATSRSATYTLTRTERKIPEAPEVRGNYVEITGRTHVAIGSDRGDSIIMAGNIVRVKKGGDIDIAFRSCAGSSRRIIANNVVAVDPGGKCGYAVDVRGSEAAAAIWGSQVRPLEGRAPLTAEASLGRRACAWAPSGQSDFRAKDTRTNAFLSMSGSMSKYSLRKRFSELSIFRAFYFLLFVPWGISAPFLPLFFKRQGLTDAQVGFLAAIAPFLMVFSPLLWGAAADRTRNPKAIVILLLAAQGALFPTFLLSRDFHVLVLMNLVFSFFSVALIPMSDALTFRHLGPRAGEYGTIRLWGTLGFIFPLATMGALLGKGGGNGGSLSPLFVVFSLGSAAALVTALRLPNPGRGQGRRSSGGLAADPREQSEAPEASAPQGRRRSAFHLLAQKEVLVFLVAAFVARLAAQPGFVFFSIYLDELGVADSVKGYLWALGAICEVPIMRAAPRLLERPGLKWLLALAIGLGAARLFALSFRLSLPALLVVQPVLAVTFAGFHIPTLTFVNRIAPPSMQASAQTLFSGLIYGLSGVVGSPLGGWLSEAVGIFGLYRALAAVMAVSFLLVCFGFRPERTAPDSAQA